MSSSSSNIHSHGNPKRARIGSELELCPPRDFSHYYSCATKRRVGSNVKQFYKYFKIPGIHNLAGGLPHVSYFPFDSLEASVALPDRIPKYEPSPGVQGARRNISTACGLPSQKVVVPKESGNPDFLTKIDLKTALQYGTAEGYPPLHSFIRQFVRETLHPDVPFRGGPEIVLTCGSTDGFSKTIEAFTDVWDEGRDRIYDRQGILCEEFAYMNAIQTARPRGLNIVPVAVDSYGMSVSGSCGLEEILENWDFSLGRRPHLMYTVTIGQNPTGSVLPLERRKEIYALCQKYDIIIVEDDPYWHLQYPSADEKLRRRHGDRYPKVQGEPSGFPFLDSLVGSYLSIDTDGRVVRLDTLSKIIAPGCRLGWLTAQPSIVERILRITETSTQQPSGFVQSMVAKLIMGDQITKVSGGKPRGPDAPGWRMDGWVRWLEGLRGGYEKRMHTMCTILDQGRFFNDPVTSPTYMADWEIIQNYPIFRFEWPRGGMFVWVQLCLEMHPLAFHLPFAELAAALWRHLIKEPYRLIVAPGWLFASTEEIKENAWRYMRLCFAAMDEDDVATSSNKFIEGCRSFWRIEDLRDLPPVDEEGEAVDLHNAFGQAL